MIKEAHLTWLCKPFVATVYFEVDDALALIGPDGDTWIRRPHGDAEIAMLDARAVFRQWTVPPPAEVKRLRKETGASWHACKAAWVECEGKLNAAAERLRTKGHA